MQPILMFSADWHYSGGVRRGIDDARYAHAQATDYQLEHKIPHIAAGDLIDKDDPDPLPVTLINRQMDRLAEAKLPFGFIVGQHDRSLRGGRWLGNHKWPIALDEQLVEFAGMLVYGLDWVPPAALPVKIAAIPREAQIVTMHQVCAELMHINHEVVLADIPGNALLVVGDYHAATIINAGSHRVVSPGSFCIQSIDENPMKSFVILDEEHQLHRIPLKTRQVGHFDLHTSDDLDRFLADRPWEPLLAANGLPVELQRPVISVKYFDDIPASTTRLQEALAALVHYVSIPLDRKRHQRDKKAVEASRVFDLRAALAASVPADDPVVQPLGRLLAASAKQLSGELAMVKREFITQSTSLGAPNV